MKDAYGRRIDYLRLSVTDLCNYRCIYCMPDSGVPKRDHSEILSVEELVDAAAQAVRCGVRKVRVTGGEPLVRRGILDICRGVASLDVEELCLTTNGSLLSGYAQALRDAGVNRLNISLDTLRPERFVRLTRRGSLSDVMEGVEAASRAGFDRLKFNVVLMGGVNDDEIADFVALTRDRPVEVRFIELMPVGVRRVGPFPVRRGAEGPRVLSGADSNEEGWCGGSLPRSGIRGNGGADPAPQPQVLWGLQPHPDHGGRQVEAMPPLRDGNPVEGVEGRGAVPGHPGGNPAEAHAARDGAPGQPECTHHEQDRGLT